MAGTKGFLFRAKRKRDEKKPRLPNSISFTNKILERKYINW